MSYITPKPLNNSIVPNVIYTEISKKQKEALWRTGLWSKRSAMYSFDSNSFNVDAFRRDCSMYSPKLEQLMAQCKNVEETHKKKGNPFPLKQVIYTNASTNGIGFKQVASALCAMGKKFNEDFVIYTTRVMFQKNVSNKKRAEMVNLFHSSDKCEYMIIDRLVKEGITLGNVSVFHVLDSPENEEEKKQIKGRVIRMCRHNELPFDSKKGWVINILYYDYLLSENERLGDRIVTPEYEIITRMNQFKSSCVPQVLHIPRGGNSDSSSPINPISSTQAENELDEIFDAGERIKARFALECLGFVIDDSLIHEKSGRFEKEVNAVVGNNAELMDKFRQIMMTDFLEDRNNKINNDVFKQLRPILEKERHEYEDKVLRYSNDDNAYDKWREWGQQRFKQLVDEYFHDFRDTGTLTNKCSVDGTFSLIPIQRFAEQYIRPLYRDIRGWWLWQTVGTGKTCSAIAIAFKRFFVEGNYKILYVTKHTLKHEIEEKLGLRTNSGKPMSQCGYDDKTPLSFITSLKKQYENAERSWVRANKGEISKITKYIRVLSYREFSNRVEKWVNQLSKTLVIIDEAHLMYDGSLDSNAQPNVEAIENAIQFSHKNNPKTPCRVLLMTATPPTQSYTNMARFLNLINPVFDMSHSEEQLKQQMTTRMLARSFGRQVIYHDGSTDYSRFARAKEWRVDIPLPSPPELRVEQADDIANDKSYNGVTMKLSDTKRRRRAKDDTTIQDMERVLKGQFPNRTEQLAIMYHGKQEKKYREMKYKEEWEKYMEERQARKQNIREQKKKTKKRQERMKKEQKKSKRRMPLVQIEREYPVYAKLSKIFGRM